MSGFKAWRKTRQWAVWVVGACLLPAGVLANEVVGAGASFPSKVYERWGQIYQRQSNVRIQYKSTGSGDGLKQITARTVDFGASDTPLPQEELARRKLVQFPMLVGGVVPVVHLPGVTSNSLVLSGEVLAGILSQDIKRWNDPRIAALNPELSLPAQPILRIVRADRSGTTENLTRYLSAASETFRKEIGPESQPRWPGDVKAVEGNDGVASAVKQTPGAIGYVSYDRVVADGLVAVRLRNAAGVAVTASEASFRAAIMESDVQKRGDDQASLLDMPGRGTWPVTQVSFVLVDAQPAQAMQASHALRFLYWCFLRGDELTQGTGFAPLPTRLQAKLVARLASVKSAQGQPLDFVSH